MGLSEAAVSVTPFVASKTKNTFLLKFPYLEIKRKKKIDFSKKNCHQIRPMRLVHGIALLAMDFIPPSFDWQKQVAFSSLTVRELEGRNQTRLSHSFENSTWQLHLQGKTLHNKQPQCRSKNKGKPSSGAVKWARTETAISSSRCRCQGERSTPSLHFALRLQLRDACTRLERSMAWCPLLFVRSRGAGLKLAETRKIANHFLVLLKHHDSRRK